MREISLLTCAIESEKYIRLRIRTVHGWGDVADGINVPSRLPLLLLGRKLLSTPLFAHLLFYLGAIDQRSRSFANTHSVYTLYPLALRLLITEFSRQQSFVTMLLL